MSLLVGGSNSMTLGRKSIYTVINVSNTKNPEKSYKVTVQANKNYGICNMSPRVGEILSDFQGRQINDELVMSSLEDSLYNELNTKKEN